MTHPKIIAITGNAGSGKGAVAKMISELHPDKKIVMLRFSEMLADILDLLDLPHTRYNLQHVAIFLNEGFGKGTITRGMEKRIRKTHADVIIIDGARWDTDLKMIKELPNSTLIYIEAEPKIRFERLKERREKAGEDVMSFEDFEKSEQVKTETFLEEIKKAAEVVIENNGTVEELKDKVLGVRF